MASIKLSETKDGRRFFQISVSRGYGKAPYKTRWYWPDGWSKRTAEREAAKRAAAFELACKNGKVLNRAQEREKAAQPPLPGLAMVRMADTMASATARGFCSEVAALSR